jgi:hypothetical protein
VLANRSKRDQYCFLQHFALAFIHSLAGRAPRSTFLALPIQLKTTTHSSLVASITSSFSIYSFLPNCSQTPLTYFFLVYQVFFSYSSNDFLETHNPHALKKRKKKLSALIASLIFYLSVHIQPDTPTLYLNATVAMENDLLIAQMEDLEVPRTLALISPPQCNLRQKLSHTGMQSTRSHFSLLCSLSVFPPLPTML